MAILFTLEIYILILLLSVFMNRALRWLGMEESYFGQLAQWLQRWLILPVTGIMWIIRWLVVYLRDCFGFARQVTRGRRRKRQRQEDETFEFGGKTYHVCADRHGEKHMEATSVIARAILEEWIWTIPATFNKAICDNYKSYLRIAIYAYAYDEEKTDLICLGEIIGIDEGTDKKAEETSVVQLYYGEKSHMCPKAESCLLRDKELSICHPEGATECSIKHKCTVDDIKISV